MSGNFDMSDYVDVAARIQEFRAKHPEGTIQSELIDLPPAFAEKFIAVKTYAYRTPDDPRPGIALAWEAVPGKTNFTRESELMNAETSAIGRALIAVGAADAKKGIASKNEVQSRQQDTPRQQPQPTTAAEAPAEQPPADLQNRAEGIQLRKRIRAERPDHPAVIDGTLPGLSIEELREIAG